MNLFVIKIYEFILSTWLFSVSYDWFHLILNTFVLCIALGLIARVSSGRAIMLSFSAHFFAFMCFSFVAIGLFAYHIAIEFIPSDLTEVAGAKDILLSSLQVGAVYGVLQSLFILLLHISSDLVQARLFSAIWISNMISACLSYFCITTIMRLLA